MLSLSRMLFLSVSLIAPRPHAGVVSFRTLVTRLRLGTSAQIEIIGSPASVVGLIPMRGAGVRMSLFFVFPFPTSLASTTSTLEILDLSLQVLDLTLQPFFVVTGSCVQLLHLVGILITRLMLPYCSGCRQRRTSGATMACCKDVFIG